MTSRQATEGTGVFAHRLAERMNAVGTNPSRLSRAIGGVDTVRMILTGRSKNPTVKTIQALARELQCDPNYLLGNTDDPGRGPAPAETPSPDYELSLISQGPEMALLSFRKSLPMVTALKILALLDDGS